MHGSTFDHILPDSGAQFSSINKRLVDKFKLQIEPPAADEPSSLNGASSSMRVARIGYVDLPVCVHFPLDSKKQVIEVEKKRFEVMEMKHDFIFGFYFEIFIEPFQIQYLYFLLEFRSERYHTYFVFHVHFK
jgi:hypothetical protein